MANYYPTFNQYGYGNNPNPYLQQMNQPVQQQIMQPMQQQVQPSMIYGKIVDSIDTARAQEVQLGSYGVFPKADMSCIWIKAWNPDGTTSVIEYPRLTVAEPQGDRDILEDIYSSISELSKKIDNLEKPTFQQKKKREVSQDV